MARHVALGHIQHPKTNLYLVRHNHPVGKAADCFIATDAEQGEMHTIGIPGHVVSCEE